MYVYTSINLRNNITFYYKFLAYRRIRRESRIQNATHRRAVKKLVVVSKRIWKSLVVELLRFFVIHYAHDAAQLDATRRISFPLFRLW